LDIDLHHSQVVQYLDIDLHHSQVVQYLDIDLRYSQEYSDMAGGTRQDYEHMAK